MTRIKKVTVEGAKFFNDNLEIEFSNKLNCIMGGRGTGKTTLLSLITASLESNVEQNKDILSLLSSNLGQGKIRLTIEDIEGELFEVEKVLGDNPVVYTADRSLIDFDSFKELADVTPTYLPQYDPEFWKGHNIIEPNQAIKDFKIMQPED